MVVASTGEVSTFASEEEYPEKVIKTFPLAGASVNINVKKKGLHRSFLSLPAIDGGACLYFGPAPAQAKVMSAEEKAKAMEKLAGGGGGPAWLSDPSFPSMDEMGRAKSHKDYGKGDADLETRVKAAKKAAASAPEPEPEDSSSDEEEEKIGWADMVGFVWALAALDPPVKVGTGGGADGANPLLADDSNPLLNGSDDDDDDDEEFVEQEVKYTHHAPEPESPDSSDSSDDEEPEDPGPQVRLKREFPHLQTFGAIAPLLRLSVVAETDKGACVSKFGPKAAKCKGMVRVHALQTCASRPDLSATCCSEVWRLARQDQRQGHEAVDR